MDNFKCENIDTFESGSICFDFCGLCYIACSTHCKYYGRCKTCEHNKDPASYCLTCFRSSRAEENKKAE